MAILSKNGHLKRYSPSYVKLLISFCTNAWHFAQMLGFKYDSWQYCQKWSFKKIFLQLRKTSLSFCTNEKNVLQREIKDWVFEFYLLTGEPSQFMISADWIIEHDLFHILSWFLNSWFSFETERVEIVFGWLRSCLDSVK